LKTWNAGKEAVMPYVNIRITKEGATSEQKAALIRGVTDLLVNILGKNPQTTVVTIDEIETDNWGIGGETVTQRRKSKERGSQK
jgi:4-oxalocrotonate tautomerase